MDDSAHTRQAPVAEVEEVVKASKKQTLAQIMENALPPEEVRKRKNPHPRGTLEPAGYVTARKKRKANRRRR